MLHVTDSAVPRVICDGLRVTLTPDGNRLRAAGELGHHLHIQNIAELFRPTDPTSHRVPPLYFVRTQPPYQDL